MATTAVAQSRLDRLITLLESGSTPAIRSTAARQLGQIAAVRVREGRTHASVTQRTAAISAASTSIAVKKEEQEQDGSHNATPLPAENPADSSTATVSPIDGSGASHYRGLEGDWDQAVLLIARVLPHLRAKVWDTRVAAAQAIESICAASGIWDPNVAEQQISTSHSSINTLGTAEGDALFTFESFSLSSIFSSGKKLLSSAGNEYDLPASMSIEDRLANAKRDMQQLGLGSMAGVDVDLGMDVEKELLSGSIGDGSSSRKEASTSNASPSQTIASAAADAPAPAPAEEIDMSKLSARERNQLKRKRKLEGKSGMPTLDTNKTRKLDTAESISPAATKPAIGKNGQDSNELARGRSSVDVASASQSPTVSSSSISAANATSLVVPRNQWPFTLICALLLSDLFSPKWEIRHGAALGLRELFKLQGISGGKLVSDISDTAHEHTVKKELDEAKSNPSIPSSTDNVALHAQWCNDAALRLLCVLTLDRLGDFVNDQVIAPVRETTAQALASLMKWMDDESVAKVHGVLHDMITQDFLISATQKDDQDMHHMLNARRGVSGYAWEVRHAGLLGLQYEVKVRKDLLKQGDLLKDATRLAIACLRDGDDDVRSVAAATVLPIVDQIVESLPSLVSPLLAQLWQSLESLKDDLSSSTGGVMDLLASLAEKSQVVHSQFYATSSVADLIPRLYPFFRHTITSVRIAVLNALRNFLSTPSLSTAWIDDRLVRLVFQNLIVEERLAIREASVNVWTQTLKVLVEENLAATHIGPHVNDFFALLMTPLGTPIDFSLFFKASSGIASRETHNVDKGILAQDLALVGVDTVIRGRLGAAQALGSVLAAWPLEADSAPFMPVLTYLQSTCALQKCLSGVVIQEWAERAKSASTLVSNNDLARQAHAQLVAILEQPAPSTYAEMAVMLQRIQRQCHGLYTAFARDGKVKKDRVPTLPSNVDPTGQSKEAFTIDWAKSVVGHGFENLLNAVPSKQKASVLPDLEDRRAKLIAEVGFYQSIKEKQDSQVAASAAAAVIALQVLPSKLNPVIRSVMNSVKFEENVDLQRRSARAVANLIQLLSQRPNNPSEKIAKNLCAFICQDTTQTPVFERVKQQRDGIFSLIEAERDAAANSTGQSLSRSRSGTNIKGAADAESLTEEERQGKNIRRGAEVALQEISVRFGATLFESLPVLWQSVSGSLSEVFGAQAGDVNDESGQAVIDCCALLQVLVQHTHESLRAQICTLLVPLTNAVKSTYSVVRSIAAKTISRLAEHMTQEVMIHIVKDILPLLGDATNVTNRQGAMEAVAQAVRLMDLQLLPYVVVLIVPVLGRMSDPDESVRLVATNTFASLVKMVPLEAGLPDPPGFPAELMAKRQEERQFFAQLLDGSKVDTYEIPVEIKADLRKYQVDGVSWMAFLAKFQLHGVLCDDMGLGKTLQSICILSSKHFERAKRFSETQIPEARPLPSLIVCPPTLTGHWCHEIKQYATNLRPLLYAGQPAERARLQSRIAEYDCVVASYDTVRNDVAALSKYDWLYCILDEGHIIKSAKTKTTKAVKQIRAQHRMILSGTPIQNNVLELWSLFDFLMPGFLGTEKQFMDRYGRPILASRDAKVTAREHERASLALESLHKQVLPFLLRRMKEDVLDDLPPKIIQDISCDMSDVQRQLFEDYMRTQNPDDFDDQALQEQQQQGENGQGKSEAKQHIFQTLQYLRKLVCHPTMVFDASKSRHAEIQRSLQQAGRSLNDLANAPKLLALRQLLQDCGIGNDAVGPTSASKDNKAQSIDDFASDAGAMGVSQHRVLIFCQQRQMLDIIEKDLLRKSMPSVTYARLDGSITSPEKRFAIVQRFNADPSIDVLLLTTSVGGLGLTLTGADTVIFVEHDWNPMKDMQAMDRAHRLGQKKVVNVYRLITKDTLEEQIMGLQRFKLNVAGNIVNQQNKSTDSMQTDQILDLFDTGGDSKQGAGGEVKGAKLKAGKGISQKALLASLEEMEGGEDGDALDEYKDMQQWSAS